MMSVFKNGSKTEDIKERVRKSPTVLNKSYNGNAVDIKVYALYHADGLALLYVNNTPNMTISEEIEFDLQNCHIDGTYGSYIEISVAPK